MILSVFSLACLLIVAVESTTKFKSTCNTVDNQMFSLRQCVSQVKAIADRNGHSAISSKCDQAYQHLNAARNSWISIANNFGRFPWEAKSSPHSGRCQSRLSSCGESIEWIYYRPEIWRFPAYRIPISNCRNIHRSCQSTCGTVWNWPTPPGYRPKPSGGYYRRQRRDQQDAMCPVNQVACPISANTTGHECIDVKTEITSCGGCTSNNEGENCLAIEGADEVGCESGACRVFSCRNGFKLNDTTGRPEPILPQVMGA